MTNYSSLCFKYFLLLSERMFPMLTIKINVPVKQKKSKKISSSFFVLFWSPIDYFYCLFFKICWLIFNYFVNSHFEVFIYNLVVCNWLFYELRSCFTTFIMFFGSFQQLLLVGVRHFSCCHIITFLPFKYLNAHPWKM